MQFAPITKFALYHKKVEDITMHLFETKDGDRWVCAYCKKEQKQMLEDDEWEYLFDKDDPMLRCALCRHPDIEVED